MKSNWFKRLFPQVNRSEITDWAKEWPFTARVVGFLFIPIIPIFGVLVRFYYSVKHAATDAWRAFRCEWRYTLEDLSSAMSWVVRFTFRGWHDDE